MRFLVRLFALVVLAWLIGFAWFAVFLPGPADGERPDGSRTDAIIVPTGAAGRIERGLELLAAGQADELLVTGVDPEVKAAEFAEQFGASMAQMECCVTLGYLAVDTRSNAAETARWVAERKARTIRLVTTDWHMRRTYGEVRDALPTNVDIVQDAVRSEPSFRTLFLEYHKFLASWISRREWFGL